MPKIDGLPLITAPAADDEFAIVDVDEATTKKIPLGLIVPPGMIVDYAGNAAPTGWLLCYGQTLNAVTSPQYQDLYDAIGNIYGGSDHSNFVVPDLRGRVVAGQDDMGGSSANRLTGVTGSLDGDILGAVGGLETQIVIGVAKLAIAAANPWAYYQRVTAPNGSWTATHQGPSGTGAGSTSTSTSGAGLDANTPAIQPTIILNKIIKY